MERRGDRPIKLDRSDRASAVRLHARHECFKIGLLLCAELDSRDIVGLGWRRVIDMHQVIGAPVRRAIANA